MKNLSNTEAELKNSVAYKISVYRFFEFYLIENLCFPLGD